ncbi:MAG TPA: type II toxin-antitoxin system VapC family toxin [Methylobacterium sp.]|uniref:type II toxin-antitoxin system VapC family toxin n=1 Tax=Methylorubrum sp. B1-46 TaxID=2897334 RepID=UPI001E37C879|nr:type II toxin-antitoxin system VapC family toxin [Methylorubrum sp. B1-46]UGB26759.1 type II toxin-antitoxin system VapC family toxin [Methylorubrum sp. B1-46]HEV2543819.1 type II toxin-antitoxin system VapC family toxin [Methylobacterium sp.]
MIVLDTNVLSELWRATPDPGVLTWVDAQAVETLYLTAVTVAELRFGLATMPADKRRDIFRDRLEREVLPAFAGRVLPFDLDASRHYAAFMARARAAGKAIGMADGTIAATAAVRGFIVATRDTGPFEATGIGVINPWRTAG